MSAHALQLTSPVAEVWLPYREALALCERTNQWFSQQIREGRIRVRITDRVQRNGRPDREIALASLPQHARNRYEREQQPAPAVQTSLPLFGAPQLVKPTSPRVRVAPQHSSEAERRRQILEPILAMSDPHHRHIYACGVPLPDGSIRKITSQNQMVAFVIEQQRQQGTVLSERTLTRWLKAHKAEGTAGLQRKRREDAGQSRWFAQHPKAAALVAFLYLGDGVQQGLSVQACYDMLLAQRELADIDEDDLPHYHTVRAFLGAITPALKMYSRKGKEEFAGAMLPYLSRAYNEAANWCWVSDHMIADVEVMNDCFHGAPMGAPVRLRLTALLDYRARYLVGYTWAWEGTSASIADALRNAVLQHGPCELFYCDNGKDYLKVAKGSLPGYMQPSSVEAADWYAREMARIDQTGVLARLGIQVTHCIVRHPQSKHVERFFRTVHETFCKLWSTYTGGKPSLRPDNTSALMAVHRRALRHGDLTQSHHPLASEFIAAFDNWLRMYHGKPQDGEGMDGRSPAQVFAQERNPNQRPKPSREELVPLLWDIKRVTVSESQVTVNGVQYAPTDAVQAQLMFHLNRRKVNVAYSQIDASCVAVLSDDNRLLTMLDRKTLVRMAPNDERTQAQIAAIQQQRGTLVRGVRDDRETVVRAGRQLGALHPLQLLGTGSNAPSVERITPRKPRGTEIPSSEPLATNQIAARIRERLKRSS